MCSSDLELQQHEMFTDTVPRRVREGGLGGREERHIERRHDAAVHQHFRRVADAAFRVFQRDKFDWLILGGQREVLREFKGALHPYLRARWAGDFHADVNIITPADILAETLSIEENVEAAEEQRLVDELLAKAEAGKLAVAGMGETLDAVARGEAQTLLVDSGFEMPGYACLDCHLPSLESRECPQCSKPTVPCADIIDEMIELAMQKNCRVEHVHARTPLRDAGRIGALLRYRS